MRKIMIAVGAFVLVSVGYGMGASEPDVVTKTVEVPGPTREVEVPGETKTETVTEEITPQVCLDAMDRSDDMRKLAAGGFSVIVKMTPLVVRALEAGIDNNVVETQAITREMQQINKKMESLNSRTDGVLADLEQAQAECRGMSG